MTPAIAAACHETGGGAVNRVTAAKAAPKIRPLDKPTTHGGLVSR
jgi:hypothetical protein